MARKRNRLRRILASDKTTPIIAIEAPVEILAGEADGEKQGPKKFQVNAYTGAPIRVGGYDLPIVVDLAGLEYSNSLIANLDHDGSKRVGHVTERTNDGKSLQLAGVASAATEARREVVESADAGFTWQASIEASPLVQPEQIKKGQAVTVNGRTVEGPAYIARKTKLTGFAFVSHGADDDTTVAIAATADNRQEKKNMEAKIKAWAEGIGIEVDESNAEQCAAIEASYNATQTTPRPIQAKTVDDVLTQQRNELARQQRIAEITAEAISGDPLADADCVNRLEALARQAVEAKWTPEKYELEVLRASRPKAAPAFHVRREGHINNRVIEAAICQSGRLEGIEEKFSDQELQAAHDKFRNGIGLQQLFLMCAEANGYRGSYASNVTIDVQRSAFGMTAPNRIHASGSGFSTLDIATIVSATANKFLREGFYHVDMTPLNIAAIRPVRNFQQTTTVSLTGDLMFEELGAGGEIKHGSLGELSYTNQADTYAKMLAITRKDIINDDLSALTAVPRRLGRGAGLKLNDIFWTEFLGAENEGFFAAGNSNVNTGVADMTVGGLEATEVIFMDQTDPNGKPLGVMPKIIVVPTALKSKALALMDSEKIIDGTSTSKQGDANPFRGRFRVESSPYLSNSSYTGYSASAWYMLADPMELPMIEIAALNGRVEPTIDTADADFNTLGVQMRGYSDVGVNLQEYRAAVKPDGGTS